MVFQKGPDPDLMIAFAKSNTINMPHFSDVRIEGGQVTIQVEFKPELFDTEDYLEHLHDTQERYLEAKPAFPFKFEYFDVTWPKFRVSLDELKTWKELTCENGSTTVVSFELYDALSKAFRAAEYFQKKHKNELKPQIGASGNSSWRFEVA